MQQLTFIVGLIMQCQRGGIANKKQCSTYSLCTQLGTKCKHFLSLKSEIFYKGAHKGTKEGKGCRDIRRVSQEELRLGNKRFGRRKKVRASGRKRKKLEVAQGFGCGKTD